MAAFHEKTLKMATQDQRTEAERLVVEWRTGKWTSLRDGQN